ncbi:MAG: hypothetical protein JJ900_08765 [Rhodospirillales bacterium]|nr:hypothetical protein [Rhodospirillales bacterium]MBO6786930.1 hypothetical protein [Rhodospirillales bacterium]
MNRIALLPALFAIFVCVSSQPANAQSFDCALSFEVVAGNTLGTVTPGDRLKGMLTFKTTSAWQQDIETLSYAADGQVSVTHPSAGTVHAKVRVVHVVRTPYIADYISIDAHEAGGNLGGENRYEDPMLVTFYAPPVTLETSDIPRTLQDWNQLRKRRVFQVHTPDAMATFYGDFENLKGGCE